jgi:hypothetical protein
MQMVAAKEDASPGIVRFDKRSAFASCYQPRRFG